MRRDTQRMRLHKYTCTVFLRANSTQNHNHSSAEAYGTYPRAIPDSPSCMSPNIALDEASASFSFVHVALSCDSGAACMRIWSSHSSLRPAPPSRASGPASALASSARLSNSSTCALIGLIDRAYNRSIPERAAMSVNTPHLGKRGGKRDVS